MRALVAGAVAMCFLVPPRLPPVLASAAPPAPPGQPAAVAAMRVGDVWGMGLATEPGRRLLAASGVRFVKLLARPEYLAAGGERALDDARHTPWPWLDAEYRISLDRQIVCARELGLEVVLVVDPGSTAVSARTGRAIAGEQTSVDGDPWLLPRAGAGYTRQQAEAYAELVAGLARACERRYPGTVTWMQIGNEPSGRGVFPPVAYLRLLRAVMARLRGEGLAVKILAGDGDLCGEPFLALELARTLADGELPDGLGFHWLPQFERCRLPSFAEHATALRAALGGNRSWRGAPVELWCDEWSFLTRQGRDADPAARAARLLREQAGAGLDASALVSVVTVAPLGERPWGLGDTEGERAPSFQLFTQAVGDLSTFSRAAP